MKNILLFGIVFIMMISIVYAAGKPTTTTTTSTTTTITIGNLINPTLKYVNNLSPSQLLALKTKVINYLQPKLNLCLTDVNLNPKHFSFRFKNSYFVALDLTLCNGKHMIYISQYSKLEARVLR